jgi:hypothetical protein
LCVIIAAIDLLWPDWICQGFLFQEVGRMRVVLTSIALAVLSHAAIVCLYAVAVVGEDYSGYAWLPVAILDLLGVIVVQVLLSSEVNQIGPSLKIYLVAGSIQWGLIAMTSSIVILRRRSERYRQGWN